MCSNLPVNKKLEIVSNVINICGQDGKFYNPGKIEIYFTLEMIYNYTNIKFTDKQKEDVVKLYDILQSSELKQEIFDIIPPEEVEFIYTTIIDTIENIYKYNNSAYGILDSVVNDYDGLNFDANEIYQKIANGENVEFLKEVMAKLG